jgi:hypothetical protein
VRWLSWNSLQGRIIFKKDLKEKHIKYKFKPFNILSTGGCKKERNDENKVKRHLGRVNKGLVVFSSASISN